MAELSKATSEEFEHDEHAIEEGEGSGEGKDPFVQRVSVTIAVLAVVGVVLGSVESLETAEAARANSEAVLHQDRATDAWNAFEAKTIRSMLARVAPAGAAGSNAAAGAATSDPAPPERFKDRDADGLAAAAREEERLSQESIAKVEAHSARHHVLTVAVTLVQVAIAIATISIIARRQRWPWYAAIALGVAGVLTGATAFLA